ncbi:MAG: hypothetical protein AMJ45_07205 [Syntrophobacter sp. DG_60]|nr:MAG: hypothetical protein AMJ45_07205 [Syntrophobacter sp. DG_60]
MKLLFYILVFSVFANPGFAEDLIPSPQEILDRVEASFEKIDDYVVILEEAIRMEGVKVPKTKAILYYKKPNKIHIESKGIMFIPKQGMVINPSYYLKRYFMPLNTEEEIVKGTKFYKLILIPKEEGLSKKITLWVESKYWSIKKIKITGFGGGSVLVHIEYTMVKGKYWLPKSTLVELDIPAKTPRPEIFDYFGELDARKEKKPSKPKKGIVSILFKNYKVNTGLPDKIFKKR